MHYYQPGVRDLYGTHPVHGRRGVPDKARPGTAAPTSHPAGSAAKVAVLAERAAAGLPLFADGDNPDCCPSTDVARCGRPSDVPFSELAPPEAERPRRGRLGTLRFGRVIVMRA